MYIVHLLRATVFAGKLPEHLCICIGLTKTAVSDGLSLPVSKLWEEREMDLCISMAVSKILFDRFVSVPEERQKREFVGRGGRKGQEAGSMRQVA